MLGDMAYHRQSILMSVVVIVNRAAVRRCNERHPAKKSEGRKNYYAIQQERIPL